MLTMETISFCHLLKDPNANLSAKQGLQFGIYNGSIRYAWQVFKVEKCWKSLLHFRSPSNTKGWLYGWKETLRINHQFIPLNDTMCRIHWTFCVARPRVMFLTLINGVTIVWGKSDALVLYQQHRWLVEKLVWIANKLKSLSNTFDRNAHAKQMPTERWHSNALLTPP